MTPYTWFEGKPANSVLTEGFLLSYSSSIKLNFTSISINGRKVCGLDDTLPTDVPVPTDVSVPTDAPTEGNKALHTSLWVKKSGAKYQETKYTRAHEARG